MGFLSGSQFNLVISLRYTPVAGEMPFWCQLLEQTSRIIHDSTDGVLSIGQVLISANSMGGKDADIWVHPNDDVWPNSTGALLWLPFESIDVSQDYMFYVTILVHELSHYLYGLLDEYNNDSVCLGDITTQACIMEGYLWNNYTRWTDGASAEFPNWVTFFPAFTGGTAVLQLGNPSEYCHDGNHNGAANNDQNNFNGGSCWKHMAKDAKHNNIPYGLVIPGAGGPALPAPVLPAASVCTELIPVQRFMLVLDRSGSMLGTKIDQLKIGANFWVDYVNSAEELGLVTYAGSESLDFAKSAVPSGAVAQTAWRNTRHTAVLFTDGLQNAGSETAEDVLPDCVAGGVRVYTIGLGNDQDAVLLGNIAATTGATYFPIDGAGPDGTAADAAPPFDWEFGPREDRPRPRPRRSFSFPVRITEGSRHCSLGALWKDPKRKFTVRVADPDGYTVTSGPGVRRVAGKYPYSFYAIDNPKAGTWTVTVSGASIGTTRFRTIGFEVNDRISFDVSLVHAHVRRGTDIDLRARLRAPFAVPSARMTGWALTPSGKWIEFKFTEHTGASGDPNAPYTYTARVPTGKEQPGQYLLVVDARRARGKFVLELDELYRQRPGLKPEQMKHEVNVPAIRRRATVAATVDGEGPTRKEPITGFNSKAPFVPRNQTALLKRWKKANEATW